MVVEEGVASPEDVDGMWQISPRRASRRSGLSGGERRTPRLSRATP
jgi:hypothetical protein